MSVYENARKLQEMMGQGQVMEAFEKYYHKDCVVQEPTGEVRKGKEAQRKAIHEWQGTVKEMHGGGTGAITANEDAGVSSVESWMDITTKDGNRMKMEEVAVQKWQDGQIVHERFYYNMPQAPQK